MKSNPAGEREPAVPEAADEELSVAQVHAFRRKLMQWYRAHARELPWRDIRDPYATWVSEIMLQQTRVAAVIEHYERFLRQFPTVLALALAPEAEVLAAGRGWATTGERACCTRPHSSSWRSAEARFRRLGRGCARCRGSGNTPAAAIASIAFGESIAVVDGNVERVLLRVTGRAEDATAAGRAFLRRQAAALVPHKRFGTAKSDTNAAGDHNQAMMELGATICLPHAPLCLHCPVFDLCRTRGEHAALPRGLQRSHPAAYLLATRKQGTATEVLLERRDEKASLMPGMLELPPLPMDAVAGREPVLRLRHAITNTNYYVEIHAVGDPRDRSLRDAVPAAASALEWYGLRQLGSLPLTGLARKALARLDLHGVIGPQTPQREL